MTTLELGSWVMLFTTQGQSMYFVDAAHWDEIDAAHGHWIERRIDRVLSLVGRDGSDIRIAASRISDFCLSTPEARARGRELEAAEKAESGFAE